MATAPIDMTDAARDWGTLRCSSAARMSGTPTGARLANASAITKPVAAASKVQAQMRPLRTRSAKATL
jgi:hypothetical protein